VELPVVATYNDSLLASQILKNRCPWYISVQAST
jgi:hypothetical protein